MKMGFRLFTLICAAFLLAVPSFAGAKVKINDTAKFDIGFRMQTMYINTETDLDGDANLDSYDYFRVRRGRLRMKAIVGEKFEAFLQTEVGSFGTDGSGGDVRIIDGWVQYKFNKNFSTFAGLHMAPTGRQNITSSGGLLAIDRPGIVTKDLTWGTRAVHTYNTATFGQSDAKLRSGTAVRDAGLTFFYKGSGSETVHYKLYAAINNGIQAAGFDKERLTFRGQVNFFDEESGYYHLSNYFGKKKTVSIGAAVDMQDSVALNSAGDAVDYSLSTVDLHVEWPVGDNSLSFETAVVNMDLDDEEAMMVGGNAVNTKGSAGTGYYIQFGYNIGKLQPFFLYDVWDSDRDDGVGSYDQFRIGLAYYLFGNNANIKLGYEQFNADVAFLGTEDSLSSLVFGFFVTF